MIRSATMFWVAIAGLFLSALTVVGSEVRERDQALAEIHRAIAREHETIHVLKAERAYLASPERIAALAAKELGLTEFDADRVVTIAAIPAYHETPVFEFEPERLRPLVLSALTGDADAPAPQRLIQAAFLPPTGRDDARILHETAWTMNALERQGE